MQVIIVQFNSCVMNNSFHFNQSLARSVGWLKTQFCQVLVLALFGTSGGPFYAELHFGKNLRDINGGQSKEPLPETSTAVLSFKISNIEHEKI